jgi:hypothetical protein
MPKVTYRKHQDPMPDDVLLPKLQLILPEGSVRYLHHELLREKPQTKYHQINIIHDFLSEFHPKFAKITQCLNLFDMDKGQLSKILKEKRISSLHCGRKPLFTKEEEEKIIAKIKEEFQAGNPLTASALKQEICKLFGRGVSDTWLTEFCLRHHERLVKAVAKPMEHNRMELTLQQVEAYERELEAALNGVPSFNCFNIDESGCQEYVDAKPKKVIIPAEKKDEETYFKVHREGSNVSVMPCICIDGSNLCPLFLIKRKTVDDEFFTEGIVQGRNLLLRSTAKGYNTQVEFTEWITRIFLPAMKERRTLHKLEDTPAVLIADQASCHCNSEITASLIAAKIRLVHFPPHSSHIFQPLDAVIFGSQKKKLRSEMEGIGLAKQKQTLTKILFALEDATTPHKNIASFRLVGISETCTAPVRFAALDHSLFSKRVQSSNQSFLSKEVEESQTKVSTDSASPISPGHRHRL